MTKITDKKITPQETIIRGESDPWGDLSSGVSLRLFASADCGAEGFCTALATFAPAAELPYHTHEFSEAVTVLSGNAVVAVEGRTYLLGPLDCIHIPSSLPHVAVNASADTELKLLASFGDTQPTRTLVDGAEFRVISRGRNNPAPGDPEHIQRFAAGEEYELASGTSFVDLFAGRFGAVGICGGYGEFAPGSSLPCHVHDFGESVTIISGKARCETEGRHYFLSDCDTAFIPRGRPHRFLNHTDERMKMIWVYARSEPTRTLVDTGYCTGALPWDENESNSGAAK